MRLARSQNVVVRLRLLQHEPHADDIVTGKTPIAGSVEVAELDGVLQAVPNASQSECDLTGHKIETAERRLVIEQDTRASKHMECFPVVHGRPMAEQLGNPVRAARIEG